MRLTNFQLRRDTLAAEIEVDGFIWDIHNSADYVGLSQDIAANQVELSWRVNPSYTTKRYPAQAFSLRFDGVDYLEVTPRDPEMPDNEDKCLDSLSRVYATDATAELIELGVPWPPPAEDEGAFHLLFHFRGGQRVRIGCRQAEFRSQVLDAEMEPPEIELPAV
jgi:hypothetical protein